MQVSRIYGKEDALRLAALFLVTAALLLGLSARPYPAMLPETCETRAVTVDKSWRIYRKSPPRDDELAGLIYLAEAEGSGVTASPPTAAATSAAPRNGTR